MNVNELRTEEVVLLVDGVTPVTLGETLTVAQLTGLTFRPTTNLANQSSLFAFTVAAAATVPAARPEGQRSTPGDYNSVFGKALNIAVPSEARSNSVTVQVTELPTNGTLVLADGSTPIRVGQKLTLKQLSGLRFKPNPGAIPQSSLFRWNETAPGGMIISRNVALPFDGSTATPNSEQPPR